MSWATLGIAILALIFLIATVVSQISRSSASSKQAAAEGRARQLQQQISNVEKARDTLASQVSSLSTQNGTLESTNSDLDDQVATLQGQVKDLQNKLNAKPKAPPPAPNGSSVSISYGDYAGLFRISGAALQYSYGYADIYGTITHSTSPRPTTR